MATPQAAPDEAPELPPAPDVVAFDIGEVVIDESRVWAVWAGLVGVTPLTFAAVLGAAISQGGDHHDVFDHLAPNVEWETLVDEHERLLGGLGEQDLHPDVRACLTDLRAAGVTLVLAGNQPASRTAQLRALDLGCDDIVTSEELGHEKPDPAFFDALYTRLDVPAGRVLYVGDRLDNDVLPAAVSGASTCWLRRGPWGQLQEPPEGFTPDLSLEGLGELAELVIRWRQS